MKKFISKIKIYYEDTDFGGVVYHANYLKFLERARSDALYKVGLSNKLISEKFGNFIIVKSCQISFIRSAFFEEELKTLTFIEEIKKASLFMNQSIFRNKELIVKAKIHLVFVNRIGKPTKIPEIVLKSFDPYILKSK